MSIPWQSVKDSLPEEATMGAYLCLVRVRFFNEDNEIRHGITYDTYDHDHEKWRENDNVTHWCLMADLSHPLETVV